MPVVSLAWYLARHFPEYLERQHLDLWVIGAELIDGKDGGAWFACLEALLGIEAVDTRLIGPDVNAPDNEQILKRSLNEVLAQGMASPDMAVIFQPGFEENTSLLEGGLSE
jgi:hypothetical protein